MECGTTNSTFLDGEEVIYHVYYNWGFFWTMAGVVHFKVSETDSTYQIKVSGSTDGFYDNLYKVRDTFETHLDKSNLMPRMFIRDVEEGKYRRYNEFHFDQANKVVTSYKGKTRESVEMKQFEFENCMHDILSIVYHLRNMDYDDFEKGSSFPIDVFLEQAYSLDVKVLDKNKKKKVRGIGKFNSHVFEPQLIAGEVFDEDSKMTIYVSADDNKLPVMIESPLIVGKVKAILYDFKGLKYEPEALYK